MPTHDQKVASAYIDLELRHAKLSRELGEVDGEIKRFNRQMREEMAKSKESVKLLSEELGLGIPRGLQGIVSKLPGVRTAMNMAFDSVVVFALIHTVVEITEKVAEFARKSEEAARKHKEAWGNLTSSMDESNEKLKLANLKLDDANRKLEHKPEHNAMAEALLEANIAATTLGNTLTEDLKKIQTAILGTEKAGASEWLQAKAGLHGDISPIGDRAKNLQGELDDIRDDTTLSAEKKTKAINDKLTWYLQDARNSYVAAHEKLDRFNSRGKEYGVGDQHAGEAFTGNEADEAKAWKEWMHGLVSLQETANISEQHTGLQATNVKDTERANNTRLAKAEEEKAARERLVGFELDFEKQKNAYGMSVAQERTFWEDKLKAFKEGSSEYKSVYDKFTTFSTALTEKFHEIDKKTIGQNKAPTWNFNLIDENKNSDSVNKSVVDGKEQQAQIQYALAATKIHIEEATGAITEHQAAISLAALSAQDYTERIALLNTELISLHDKGIYNDLGFNVDRENEAKQQGIRNSIADLQGKSEISRILNDQAIANTSITGGIDAGIDALIKRSQEFNIQFKDLLLSTVNDVNSAILKLMTDKNVSAREEFRAAGKSIFTGIAKTGLEDAEGSALKLLGLGGNKKPTGTPGDPFYTRNVDRESLKTLSAALPEGDAKRAVQEALQAGGRSLLGWANDNNWLGKHFGWLFGSGGFFAKDKKVPQYAAGGLLSADTLTLVGEEGPELIQVGSTSKINNARDTSNIIDQNGGENPGSGVSRNQPHESRLGSLFNSLGQMAVKIGSTAFSKDKLGQNPNMSLGSPVASVGLDTPDVTGMQFHGLPAYVNGGLISPNMWSLVGENGPELLQIGNTSKINKARETSAGFTGGGSMVNHTWNIDATGSTDPAATYAAVQRAILAAAPHIAAAANAASEDHARRIPSWRH